jgi:hypothetical protein
MRQAIGMKVRLLNAGADEKKEGAHDGKQKTPAHLGRTMLCHFSHLHPRLYATSPAILSGTEAGIRAICATYNGLRAWGILIRRARGVRITLFMQNLAAI